MAESFGESIGREIVVISNSSGSGTPGESECRRLSDEAQSLMAELRRKIPVGGSSGIGEDQEIDQYLECSDGRERAIRREQAVIG